MAKVQIKFDSITPFGGIFSIMEQFDALLSDVIDSTLGLRSRTYGYQYSEIIRSLMCVFFCGGSCIEDISTHLMPHLSLHPKLKTCSADTILRAIKELTTDNITYSSPDSGKSYDFNTADTMNELLVKSLIATGEFQIPEILMDNTDRNRTSPFAFTGNRFEFRAVGSSANCASAMIALNAAVAYQLQDFKKKVDALIANGKEKTQAILSVVKDLITESKDICFDGNGYSEEWKEEAKRRGLDCETSVPLIFDSYLKDDVVKMFEQTHVFTQVELQARNEVKWEIYTKKIQIEARVLGDLAINHIVPVATRYQSLLLDNVFKIKSLFPAEKSELIATQDMEVIEKIAFHLLTIKEKVHAMVEARKVANKIENEREKAIAYHDTVAPQLDDIRYHIDKLELMVDNEMWPLPKYRELLFIR